LGAHAAQGEGFFYLKKLYFFYKDAFEASHFGRTRSARRRGFFLYNGILLQKHCGSESLWAHTQRKGEGILLFIKKNGLFLTKKLLQRFILNASAKSGFFLLQNGIFLQKRFRSESLWAHTQRK